MSDIQVGEYIRTKDGYIAKVIKTGRFTCVDTKLEYIADDNNIVKHSSNIIDLIEEGDMLNKNEVIEVKGMGLCIYDINNKNWLPIGNIDYQMGIELAIVTHEQMEGMEYKVC